MRKEKKQKLVLIFLGLIFTGLLLNGCGSKTDNSATSATNTSSVAQNVSGAGQTLDLASVATLKGVVKFEGVAPEPIDISVRGNPECALLHPEGKLKSEELLVRDGKLKNAFVYIKEGLENYSFPTPTTPVVIENKDCIYSPHVSGAQINQPISFLNQDSTLHNIHSYSKNADTFNLGLPIQGMKQTKKISSSEIMITLKCDVHPWMIGYVGVLPHPYFSVTDELGNFEIKNLPPGEYTVEVWHEKLGVQSQKIKIEPQSTKETEFKFS